MSEVALHQVAWLVVPSILLLTACSAGGGGTSSHGAGSGGSGSGVGGGFNTGPSSGAGPGAGCGANCNGQLPIIIRDFTTQNPDFEPGNNVDDKNIVTPDLGADGKPVYAGNPNTATTHGKMY